MLVFTVVTQQTWTEAPPGLNGFSKLPGLSHECVMMVMMVMMCDDDSLKVGAPHMLPCSTMPCVLLLVGLLDGLLLSRYGPAGGGLLRLHSTYRHDMKIYSSDEGRVQVRQHHGCSSPTHHAHLFCYLYQSQRGHCSSVKCVARTAESDLLADLPDEPCHGLHQWDGCLLCVCVCVYDTVCCLLSVCVVSADVSGGLHPGLTGPGRL
jgi:hypothetical protein